MALYKNLKDSDSTQDGQKYANFMESNGKLQPTPV